MLQHKVWMLIRTKLWLLSHNSLQLANQDVDLFSLAIF